MRISLTEARGQWVAAQGLAGTSDAPVPGGWVRALGGVEPYLALKARHPDLDRAAIDAAVAADRLWVVPGVRNCIWLVPTADLGLALRVGDAAYRKRTLRELAKCGVDEAEVQALAQQAHAALADGPLSPKALADRLGDAVRSLGAEGKKRGHNTALPAALRFLEGAGELKRVFPDGRLDTNRVVWARVERNLFEVSPAPVQPAEQAIELARRFFSWAGPATLAEFVRWSGLTKTACKKAVSALGLEAVTIEGLGAGFAGVGSGGPAPAGPHCLPGHDNLITLRETPAPLVDPAHQAFEVLAMRNKPTPLGAAQWILTRPIVEGGRIVGFWEYDVDAQRCVLGGVEPFDLAAARTRLDGIAALLADLDHAFKAHAIDTLKALRQRVAWVDGLPIRA